MAKTAFKGFGDVSNQTVLWPFKICSPSFFSEAGRPSSCGHARQFHPVSWTCLYHFHCCALNVVSALVSSCYYFSLLPLRCLCVEQSLTWLFTFSGMCEIVPGLHYRFVEDGPILIPNPQKCFCPEVLNTNKEMKKTPVWETESTDAMSYLVLGPESMSDFSLESNQYIQWIKFPVSRWEKGDFGCRCVSQIRRSWDFHLHSPSLRVYEVNRKAHPSKCW